MCRPSAAAPSDIRAGRATRAGDALPQIRPVPPRDRGACSLVPPARQKADEWIKYAVARRLLPQRCMPQPKPTSYSLALGAKFGSDAADRRSGGSQPGGFFESGLSAGARSGADPHCAYRRDPARHHRDFGADAIGRPPEQHQVRPGECHRHKHQHDHGRRSQRRDDCATMWRVSPLRGQARDRRPHSSPGSPVPCRSGARVSMPNPPLREHAAWPVIASAHCVTPSGVACPDWRGSLAEPQVWIRLHRQARAPDVAADLAVSPFVGSRVPSPHPGARQMSDANISDWDNGTDGLPPVSSQVAPATADR